MKKKNSAYFIPFHGSLAESIMSQLCPLLVQKYTNI